VSLHFAYGGEPPEPASAPEAAAAPARAGAPSPRGRPTAEGPRARPLRPIWEGPSCLFRHHAGSIAPGTMGIGDLRRGPGLRVDPRDLPPSADPRRGAGLLDLSVPRTISLGAALVTKVPALSDRVRLIPALLVRGVVCCRRFPRLVSVTAGALFCITPSCRDAASTVSRPRHRGADHGRQHRHHGARNPRPSRRNPRRRVAYAALVAVGSSASRAGSFWRTVCCRGSKLVGPARGRVRVAANPESSRVPIRHFFARHPLPTRRGRVLLAGLTARRLFALANPYPCPSHHAAVGPRGTSRRRRAASSSAVGVALSAPTRPARALAAPSRPSIASSIGCHFRRVREFSLLLSLTFPFSRFSISLVSHRLFPPLQVALFPRFSCLPTLHPP